MMGDDFPSDLAQWSLQKNLHATEDLKLNLGCAIEVLWEVSASPEEEAPAAETSTSEEKMKKAGRASESASSSSEGSSEEVWDTCGIGGFPVWIEKGPSSP